MHVIVHTSGRLDRPQLPALSETCCALDGCESRWTSEEFRKMHHRLLMNHAEDRCRITSGRGFSLQQKTECRVSVIDGTTG